MRLGLWVHKPSHGRVLGPVADAAVARGHRVFRVDTTLGATAALENVRLVDAVIAATPKLPDWVRTHVMPESRDRLGIPWVSIGYLQEELFLMLYDTPGLMWEWDAITTGSHEGLDLLIPKVAARPGWAKGWASVARTRFRVTGYPALDPLTTLDRQACRDKHYPGFKDKRLLLVVPAARPGRLSWWRRTAFHGPFSWFGDYLPNYRRMMAAIARYARRHDAHVVIKTRAKNLDPGWLSQYGDMVGDLDYNPATMLELMVAADAYVGFASAAAVEATAAGLHQTHIMAWPDSVEWPDYRDFRHQFYMMEGPWNAWQVAMPLDACGLPWRVDEWADQSPWPGRANPIACARALEPICGRVDGKASERVLDVVEEICHGLTRRPHLAS